MVARLSILMSRQICLFNTFETMCYLMVLEKKIIMKFNTLLKNCTYVLITSDRVAILSILIGHQIGQINTFVTRCYLMVPKAIFIVKFNTRLLKSITSGRVARLLILIAHQIDLVNIFVTRFYLMVHDSIFIVKLITRLQKSMKISLKC